VEGKEGKAEGKWPEESLKALEAKGLERATAQDVLDMTKGDLQAAYDMYVSLDRGGAQGRGQTKGGEIMCLV
jgi:hypothetical protein